MVIFYYDGRERDKEVMTTAYKNAIMVQWHPEKTPDGIIFLKNWLEIE
jgi:hypothetical protein